MSVQRFNKSQSDIQPFHIYYDMNIINNDSSFPAQPVRFNYKETRSNYFLKSPQDYFMSIVRFNLQTPSLPVFIPQINLNPNAVSTVSFPVQSMNGSFSAPGGGFINLYTNPFVSVGTVVYLGLSSGLTTSTYETSGVQNQYYRVVSNQVVNQILQLGVYNSTATGTPTSYAGGIVPVTSATSPPVANQISGGTISMSYAFFNILSMSFDGTNITINIVAQPNMSDLTTVFSVGDTIYVTNALQWNGVYRIASFAGVISVVCPAPNLATIGANLLVYPALSGGYLQSGSANYNITPYTVTMSYVSSGVTYTGSAPVVYTPNDLTQNPPIWNPANAQALTLADVTSEYYWVYNYEVFINMVNRAMSNAFWQLNGALYARTGARLPMSSTTNSLAYQPPSMSWNQSNLTAIITADNNAFGQQTTSQFVYMYFNQPMSSLFDSFPYQYPNVSPASNNYSYVVFNTNAGAGLYVVSSYSIAGVITPQYTAIQVYQDNQTASLMNPVQSIVFTSTILPVVMENVGTPLILNGTSSAITVGSTANVFPVVTDFIVPFSATNTYVPDISYVPSGEYRLVDLYGESPANQVDIQVYWKDQYGLIHPFYLASGCSGSLKLMFRRKDYNDVNIEDQ